MPVRKFRPLIIATTLGIVCVLSGAAGAQTSSTVAGTVKDTQGGIIPGASVTLISETRGTTFEAVAGNTGEHLSGAQHAGVEFQPRDGVPTVNRNTYQHVVGVDY